jgi:predicted HTH domain antitoxin
MVLNIEDDIIRNINLTQEEAKLDFALGLFIDKRVTLGQAAAIASLSQTQFLKELGKRQIPIHYEIEDFEKDLKTIENLNSDDSNK